MLKLKLLVTGGAGFIGSHLVEHFQGIASEIVVLDNLRSGYLTNLVGLDHTFVHGCITDRALVDSIMSGIDYVFHLAAMISVPDSMANPIFGDGEQTRDFISVKDVTSALAHAASNENMHGTYNVGYGNSITINQLATEIIRLTGSKSSTPPPAPATSNTPAPTSTD